MNTNNGQRGVAGLLIIIIVALAIAGGAYVYSTEKISEEEVAPTANTTARTEAQLVLPVPQTLTDAEVLGATYRISANFGGVLTLPRDVVFPSSAGKAGKLSGNVYLNEDGDLVSPPSPTGGLEAFWISGYKYTDSGRTEAIVTITGSFGASGTDERAYLVSKVGGDVVTEQR